MLPAFLRSRVGALTSSWQVGAIPQELQGGWILRIASFIKSKVYHIPAIPFASHSGFYFPPTFVGPPLSPERKTCCMLCICEALAFFRLYLRSVIFFSVISQ